MAFNFPSGATNGQQYTADNGVVYVFDGTKWNIQSTINKYAITGSNTFTGSQYITGSVEVYSDNWPEIRLINGDTGIQYHLQNTAGGNLSIHNDTIGASTLRIDSASSQGDSHVHIFGDLYVQSGSIFSISGSHGYIRALNLISGNIEGIGNVHLYSESVQNKIEGLATTGSNTFSGSQTFTSSLFDLYNDNWTELRLTNGSTGISYHLQNTAGGNFTIHNDAIGLSTLRIDSGSTQSESHVHIFGDLYVQSGSISSISGSFGRIQALNSISGNVDGIGNVELFSQSVDERLKTLQSATSSYQTDSASFDSRINSIVTESGSNLTYLLEAYASETYTLPGGFTEDPCRYSYISVTENVPSNWFNTSSYTFTPQKAGYWEINAAYDVYRNSEAAMAIRKNGSIVASAGSFNAIAQDVSKIIYLNGSTDYIDIVNTGGGSNSRSQYQQRSWFQAKFVGNISGSTDLPAGVISGSSQLTSSFDTRYALSASFVSSPNVSSIQTITSASYAAITPVSGTLYIIIG